MKNKIIIFAIISIIATTAFAQEKTVGQFAIWKPDDNQQANFEAGYKKHLEWHKLNGDTWSWFGWYFISGPRYGQFIDATFGHSWNAFDQAVKPAEDMQDNKLHVFPFAKLKTVYKVVNFPEVSTPQFLSSKSKIIKYLTINTQHILQTLEVLKTVKKNYEKFSFQTFKLVDGGTINQIIVMIGFPDWDSYSISEAFQEQVTETETRLGFKSIQSVTSETMVFRNDLSLIPD